MEYHPEIELKFVKWWVMVISYMFIEDTIPGFATEEVADDEL